MVGQQIGYSRKSLGIDNHANLMKICQRSSCRNIPSKTIRANVPGILTISFAKVFLLKYKQEIKQNRAMKQSWRRMVETVLLCKTPIIRISTFIQRNG